MIDGAVGEESERLGLAREIRFNLHQRRFRPVPAVCSTDIVIRHHLAAAQRVIVTD